MEIGFIHNCNRFDDRLSCLEHPTVDKLAAMRDIIFSVFVETCKLCYSTGQSVTVDEMLPGFRGKCEFRKSIYSIQAQ